MSGTSGEAGTASGDFWIDGEILRIVTNPDGSAAPTDNYDIVLNDEDGLDVAGGVLANRDTSNSEEAVPFHELTLTDTANFALRRFHAGKLTLSVTNAGASKAGRVKVYYR